jgi:chemotaxis protein MotB
LIGLALACCGYSEEQMQEQRDRVSGLEAELRGSSERAAELEGRLRDLEARNGELASRLRALGEEVEGLESERGQLQSSLEETTRALEELREREREQQARLAAYRATVERFRSMVDAGRLRIRVIRNRMVIELADDILFDSGRADLKPQGEAALAEIAEVLRGIEDREFQVAGHSDNVPIRSRRFASNWHLSAARAVAVAQFLLEQQVPADRLSAAGYGDTQPVAPNDTPEGRARNRRIEIVMMPNLDELPDLSALEGS